MRDVHWTTNPLLYQSIIVSFHSCVMTYYKRIESYWVTITQKCLFKCKHDYHRWLTCMFISHTSGFKNSSRDTGSACSTCLTDWTSECFLKYQLLLLSGFFSCHISKPLQEARGWIIHYTTKSDILQILLPIQQWTERGQIEVKAQYSIIIKSHQNLAWPSTSKNSRNNF